ncbi:MAG: N-acetylmuramidase [Mesorhizobium sp.]|uniref:glycoside hydrolase family 108 protein n=1 Tax=unclassified Mesorhizobium TaxID=325217 RepID=UPI000FCC7221|nr:MULTISPECIES: glycoside hydrolase family 108 protein [unclassified Mesorhizobium]RUV20369.1 N-acetylmuramidase [Mesorhizobium sp. M1A.F.Ca.IN.022.04.1.1]RUV63472.1 N-acetylmuramidase [Mesorhizobium sp. M1A.F.Ca.IN.022.02.1.1]RWG36242.1 MAG: N-acetylmuramidase [Mesorhizobium sp.]RWH27038.1 MAG: N-acetylmuramidase [Mesorhizobium sp.]TIM36043.1 MAG: N-acetylmuramidase [Mesorhizobium sp.]
MASSREKEALVRVLAHEGGYVNHPKDPGGPTNKGVTQRVYDAYRRGKGLGTRSVQQISNQEIADIYDRQYWDAVKGDELPAGVDYVLFDGAVNSGPKQSIIWLQRALGPLYKGRVDGTMGLTTIAAVNAVNDQDALIDRICDQRLTFMRRLRTWKTFGRGWSARVAEVRSIGKAWATNEAPQVANFYDGASAKAFAEDSEAAPMTAPADGALGAGAGGGVIAVTLGSLQDQLAPFSYASEWIGKIIVVLAIVSALLAIGGFAWSWYARHKAKRLAEEVGPV